MAKRAAKDSSREPPQGWLSTGVTTLNLAMSGHPDKGWQKGKYYLAVGASRSGKTWLGLTAMAEASIDKGFSDYRFVYDNPEDGALMDKEKYFGKSFSERLEEVRSETLEGFYYRASDMLQEGRPLIYLLDSMDALETEDDAEQVEKRKKAAKGGKEAGGTYGTAKAKANSQLLRTLINPLKDTGSILIIISQARMNIGFGAQFNPWTRSGGTALRFYATNELWFSITEKIKKNAGRNKRPRAIGNLCQVEIKKNRQTGREVKVDLPIYFSSGIDDVGACVSFLVEEGFWEKSQGKITAPDFEVTLSEEKLIKYVEENSLEAQLKSAVSDAWLEIEEQCSVKRKPRYGQEES
jgi:RecA/RadA recombinase